MFRGSVEGSIAVTQCKDVTYRREKERKIKTEPLSTLTLKEISDTIKEMKKKMRQI